MNRKHPIKISLIYAAATAALMLSNCATYSQKQPATYDIRAEVVHANTPMYESPHVIWGAGRRTVEETEQILYALGAGWWQRMVVKTPDGKEYAGRIRRPTWKYSMQKGDQGVATIDRRTKKLLCFHKDGVEPWHSHSKPSMSKELREKMKYSIGSVSR